MTEVSRPNQNKEDLPHGMTLLHALKGHTSSLNSVAWSPNGELLASSAADKTLRLWSPTRSSSLDGHMISINVVAWSPDCKVLASGSKDSTVRLWNPITAVLLHTLHGHLRGVRSVAWSPDGELLASGGVESSVRVWNPTTGRLEHYLEGHTGDVIAVVWSPDGNLLATSSSTGTRLDDAEVHIWRTDIWEPLAVLKDLKGCILVSWHPRFPILVTA